MNLHDASLCSLIPGDISYNYQDVSGIVVPNDSAISSIWSDFTNDPPTIEISDTSQPETIETSRDNIKIRLFNIIKWHIIKLILA